jgi:hypothetical protein
LVRMPEESSAQRRVQGMPAAAASNAALRARERPPMEPMSGCASRPT